MTRVTRYLAVTFLFAGAFAYTTASPLIADEATGTTAPPASAAEGMDATAAPVDADEGMGTTAAPAISDKGAVAATTTEVPDKAAAVVPAVSGDALGAATPPALHSSTVLEMPFVAATVAPSGEPRVPYLGEIVVTAQRMPRSLDSTPDSVSVVSREDIERAGALDLGDAARKATGLEVTRYGGPGTVSSVSVRGSRSTQVLVMQDGRPLNSPATGGANPSYLLAGPLERVEVVRGPSALLYGANALGGAVNAITARPPRQPEAEFDVRGGEFSLQAFKGRIGGPAGPGGWLFSQENVTTDGHRPNSSYAASQSVLVGELLENPRLSVVGGVFDSTLGVPGVQPAIDRMDRWPSQLSFGDDEVASLVDEQQDRRAYVNCSVTVEPATGHSLIARHYLETNRNSFEYGFVDWDDWLDKIGTLQARTRAQGAEIQYLCGPWLPEGVNLTLGGSWRKDTWWNNEESREVISGDYTADPPLRAGVETGAAFGEISFSPAARLRERAGLGLLSRLSLSAGARHDKHSMFGSVLNSHVGTVLNIEPVVVKASLGSTFRAPSMSDLFYPSSGNPDLDPERGRILEGSIETKLGNLFARCGAYERLVKDQIDWAPDDPENLLSPWRPRNVSRAKSRGLEAESRYRTGWVELSAHATTIHAVQREEGIPERFAAHVPYYTAGGTVSFLMPERSTLTVAARSSGTRRMYSGDDTKRLSPFTVVSLRVSRGLFGWLEAYAGVENLTDERYSERFGDDMKDLNYPAPGRSYFLGANARW